MERLNLHSLVSHDGCGLKVEEKRQGIYNAKEGVEEEKRMLGGEKKM